MPSRFYVINLHRFRRLKLGKKIIVIFITTFLSFVYLRAAEPTCTFTPTPGGLNSFLDSISTNGTVNYITVTSQDDIYIGGSFTQVGYPTGLGKPFDNVYGNVVAGFPIIKGGAIYAVTSDSAGGWYIGGTFTYVNGQARSRLAHIYGNGALDPLFNPAPDAEVYLLYLNNRDLYIGGYFNTIGGLARHAIARMNIDTNVIDPVINYTFPSFYGVYSVALYNNALYIGGNFPSINAAAIQNMAKVDAITGVIDANFTPNPSYIVRSILADGTSIYAGGDFSTIGGATSNYVAKLDPATGAADSGFNAALYGSNVYSLYINGSGLYIAGHFSTLNGVYRYNLAKINKNTGVLDQSFDMNLQYGDYVNSMKGYGNTIYAGGSFVWMGGNTVNNMAKVDITTGLVDANFKPSLSGSVFTLENDGTNIFIGGNFLSAGMKARTGLAKVSGATGLVDFSFPDTDGVVNTFLVDEVGGNIYVGGGFNHVEGYPRANAAKINMDTGAVDMNFYTNFSGSVMDFAFDGGRFYVGGNFDQVQGAANKGLAKVDPVTGAVDYNFCATAGYVSALEMINNRLWIGGSFTNVAGQPANYFAALDPDTGNIDSSVTVTVNNSICSIFQRGSSVYIGGGFSSVNGKTRNQLAKVDAATGSLDAKFLPGSNGSCVMAYDSVNLYTGSMRLNLDTGLKDPTYNPSPDSGVLAVALSHDGTVAHLGDSFTWFSNFELHPYYAKVYVGAPFTPTCSPTQSMTYTVSQTFTISPTFTITKTVTITRTITVTSTPTPGIPSSTLTSTITKTTTSTSSVTPVVTATPTYTATVPQAVPTCTFTPPVGMYSILHNIITSAAVHSITTTADSVYIGGAFTWVAQRTGSGAVVDTTSGDIVPGFPEAAGGEVLAVISDKNGGWYIGGAFTYVAGIARGGVAHIFSNGALDPNFNCTTNNRVCALYYDESGLYLGGYFNSVNGQARAFLAKVNGKSGALDPSFNTVITGDYTSCVQAIAGDGTNSVYFGGGFSGVNGQSRSDIAKVDRFSGALDPSFNLTMVGWVFSLLLDPANGSLYVGGYYAYIGGQYINALAKADAATGAVDTGFNANISGAEVYDMMLIGPSLYCAGQISLANNYGLLKLDKLTGVQDTSFKVNAYGGEETVYSIDYDGVNIYMGGDFASVNGYADQYMSKVDAITGARVGNFKPGAYNIVKAVCLGNAGLLAGGYFQGMNAVKRNSVAKIDAMTGILDPVFKPNVNTTYMTSPQVMTMAYSGGSLFVGGYIDYVDGYSRNNVAKVDKITGELDMSFSPVLSGGYTGGRVDAIACSGTDVYIGGEFTNAYGQAHTGLVKCNQATGAVDPDFNPVLNGSVSALLYDGSSIYCGGNFTSVSITAQPCVAKIDAATGNVDTAFNPVLGTNYASVNSLLIDGQNLFIGGSFTSVNSTPRQDAAKLNKNTGALDAAFNFGTAATVLCLAYDGANLYAGGDYSGPLTVKRLIKCNGSTGVVDASFDPGPDASVSALALSYQKTSLHAGGAFDMISLMPQAYYAEIYTGSPPTATLSPTITLTLTITQTYTISPTFTNSPTITQSWTASPTPFGTSTSTSTFTDTPTITRTFTPTGTFTVTVTPTRTITPVFSPTNTPLPYAWGDNTEVVYPVPARGHVSVMFKDGMSADRSVISIYTVNLRLVIKADEPANAANQYKVDVSGLASGIYYLKAVLKKDGNEVFRKVQPIVILK
jgi:hypothetical protein